MPSLEHFDFSSILAGMAKHGFSQEKTASCFFALSAPEVKSSRSEFSKRFPEKSRARGN
jgi:hypothetical protein